MLQEIASIVQIADTVQRATQPSFVSSQTILNFSIQIICSNPFSYIL
jgi:hypothetical protein